MNVNLVICSEKQPKMLIRILQETYIVQNDVRAERTNSTCTYVACQAFDLLILLHHMASYAKACFLSKFEYRAVIRYLYLKGKTGKEMHGELADV